MNCHSPGIDRLQFATSLALFFAVYQACANHAAAAPPASKALTNSIGMKFVSIPAGEFLMGATPDEIKERRDQIVKRSDGNEEGDDVHRDNIILIDSEAPQHRVTISKDYLLGAYEVTQQDFQTVMGFNPSVHSSTGGRQQRLKGVDTKLHPVDKVTWHDAVEFCRQLSSFDEEIAAGRSYRLPTEAEWEYACRAGSTTMFFWGNGKGRKESGDWTIYPKVGPGKRAMTAPVGSVKPNPWGLYDMPGNAYEWCADWFDPKTYAQGPSTDPVGPATGDERVVRGGMTNFFPPAFRSAARRKNAPDASNPFSGFRVVCLQGEMPQAASTVTIPAAVETQLKQKGLVRQGTLYVLAEEIEFARYTATLERMRVACFNARREIDDAKKQLQRVSAAEAGVLQARVDARNMMRYSDTWREHRVGIISRNLANDALALVNMSRNDVESWLADAQSDYDSAVSRFAEQCQSLQTMRERIQTKQSSLAADTGIKQALAAASAGGKTPYRVGASQSATASVKKLDHELTLLKQLQAK